VSDPAPAAIPASAVSAAATPPPDPLDAELARGVRMLVEEMKGTRIAHLHHPTESEAEENGALHPGHRVPSSIRITSRGADLALLQQGHGVVKQSLCIRRQRHRSVQ
jgi:hypothetical protein